MRIKGTNRALQILILVGLLLKLLGHLDINSSVIIYSEGLISFFILKNNIHKSKKDLRIYHIILRIMSIHMF